jgi:hypothetical protein
MQIEIDLLLLATLLLRTLMLLYEKYLVFSGFSVSNLIGMLYINTIFRVYCDAAV